MFKYNCTDIPMKNAKIKMYHALKNNEFVLYYQPQIDISTMKTYGVEALIRWNHPKKGILSPVHFIDIAEQNGMINEIGKFVIYKACSEIKKCHDLGYPDLYMSINICPRQLEDIFFITFLQTTLKKIHISPEYLIFEITEGQYLNHDEHTLDNISKLKDIGIKIYIDDFGMKYSSLSWLRQFSINGIKIDKSFIDEIHSSRKDFIITESIVNLANALNIEVIAEGVEKKEQLDCLRKMNCNKIQGFIFSKPVSMDKLISTLDKLNKK